MTETCINCHHWALKGSALRAEGFGHCGAEPDDVMRKAKATSAENLCRLDRFKAAGARVIDSRRKALGMQQPEGAA